MPLFTVIVSTHNREDVIAATLRSVMCQRLTDYEVIVVDDASTDDTVRVVQQFGGRIHLVRPLQVAGVGIVLALPYRDDWRI